MNNTPEEATDIKCMRRVAVVGAIVSVFALAGLGLLDEENQTGARKPVSVVPVSGTGLIIRSP